MLESDREREEYAYDNINHYLYRDLLEFDQIKKPKKVVELLIVLAHQIGREVAGSELASSLALSQWAVESYLDILEKMFVLVNIRGFAAAAQGSHQDLALLLLRYWPAQCADPKFHTTGPARGCRGTVRELVCDGTHQAR